jgi:hypothetical protein
MNTKKHHPQFVRLHIPDDAKCQSVSFLYTPQQKPLHHDIIQQINRIPSLQNTISPDFQLIQGITPVAVKCYFCLSL